MKGVNSEGDIEDLPEEEAKTDALLLAIKEHLLKMYKPVDDYGEADVRLTTNEIYDQLMRFYPGEYNQKLIAAWLHEGGFKFYDGGNLKLEWMLKKVV